MSRARIYVEAGKRLARRGGFMTMDALRRQLARTQWPVFLRVDGKDIEVGSPEELMVPPAGNLICVYQDGAFEVIDCGHIATLRRIKPSRRQTS